MRSATTVLYSRWTNLRGRIGSCESSSFLGRVPDFSYFSLDDAAGDMVNLEAQITAASLAEHLHRLDLAQLTFIF